MESPHCHGIQGRPICTADSSRHRSIDSVRVLWHFPSSLFHLSVTRNFTTTTPVGFCSAYWWTRPTSGLTIWTPPPPPLQSPMPSAALSIGVHRHLVIHPPPWQWTLSETGEPFSPKLVEKVTWPVCGDARATGRHQSPPISAVCPGHISNPDARTIMPQDERS